LGKIIDVVDWHEDLGDEMVVRFPPSGEADLKLGSQLIVRENQSAVFFRDGKAYDVFGPGRHTLTTGNIPLLTGLLKLATGETPFKAEIYFVNMKVFRNMKWGTSNPILFRDKDLGMVRLRSYGIYTMKIEDPQIFVNVIVGSEGLFTTEKIADFLKNIIVSRFTDLLGETMSTILDLTKIYDELSAGMKTKVASDFSKYGIEVRDFFINAITPPPEVEAYIDERTGMGAVGDINRYFQFKAAKSMEKAAETGGEAGAGVGLGAGLGMGMMMPQMLQQSMMGQTVVCPKCKATIPAGSKFCSFCGADLTKEQATGVECPRCGELNPPDAKFCSHCGAKMKEIITCPKCKKEIPKGSKFCPHCGEKVG